MLNIVTHPLHLPFAAPAKPYTVVHELMVNCISTYNLLKLIPLASFTVLDSPYQFWESTVMCPVNTCYICISNIFTFRNLKGKLTVIALDFVAY